MDLLRKLGLVCCLLSLVQGQLRPQRRPRPGQNLPELRRPERQNPAVNRPPVLQDGFNLVGFEINEDTPVGSEVYTLKGIGKVSR